MSCLSLHVQYHLCLRAWRAAFEAVVRDYPWRRYSRICDIGGAYGSLLSRLLQQCGKADGVLFDQPQARARKPCSVRKKNRRPCRSARASTLCTWPAASKTLMFVQGQAGWACRDPWEM